MPGDFLVALAEAARTTKPSYSRPHDDERSGLFGVAESGGGFRAELVRSIGAARYDYPGQELSDRRGRPGLRALPIAAAGKHPGTDDSEAYLLPPATGARGAALGLGCPACEVRPWARAILIGHGRCPFRTANSVAAVTGSVPGRFPRRGTACLPGLLRMVRGR